MKVSDLEGALLDFWVGRAHNINSGVLQLIAHRDSKKTVCHWRGRDGIVRRYNPSTNWQLAGEIIDQLEYVQFCTFANGCHCYLGRFEIHSGANMQIGDTKLIAAMRAFVASKLGESVDEVSGYGQQPPNKPIVAKTGERHDSKRVGRVDEAVQIQQRPKRRARAK